MGTTVFKSIIAENFMPFAERIIFTCIADESKKEHWMNTYKTGDETINKDSYVYGANGSDKTYFCKTLQKIQKMIALSPLSIMKNSQIKAILQNEGLTKQVRGLLLM